MELSGVSRNGSKNGLLSVISIVGGIFTATHGTGAHRGA